MIPELVKVLFFSDQLLPEIIASAGLWVYLVIFTIIALEEGIIFAIFLPGATLIFFAGAVAGAGQLDLAYALVAIISGAIIGSSINYWLGNAVGLPLLRRYPTLIREDHINKTSHYFDTYGGRTIFFARFIPIIRTFSPFMAGIGKMQFRRFILYNIISALVFSITIAFAGFAFGLIPEVQEYIQVLMFLLVISTIITLGFMIYFAFTGMRNAHRQDN